MLELIPVNRKLSMYLTSISNQYKRELLAKGYSKTTTVSYLNAVNSFLDHIPVTKPENLTEQMLLVI